MGGFCVITKDDIISNYQYVDTGSIVLMILKDRGAPIDGIIFLRKSELYYWCQEQLPDGSLKISWRLK